MKTKNQIAIIGLGYVGLPLAIEFSKKYKVIGFDIDKNRINQINKGHDINKDINLSKITKRNNILFTNKKNFLKDCNIYIITVPTPIFANNKPNLTIIYNAIKIISKDHYLPLNDPINSSNFNENYYLFHIDKRWERFDLVIKNKLASYT